MKTKIIFLNLLLLFLLSCSQLDFVYKDSKNLTNPIYNKTSYVFFGKDIPSIYRYASRYLGNNKAEFFNLSVSIEENKVRRSVQSNQAVEKLDYELSFNYKLNNIENNCLVYEKDIISKFSYVPKSEGYNFGSDQSLEKMYDLGAETNIIKFIRSLDDEVNLETCLDED